jgi:hypothetical protein
MSVLTPAIKVLCKELNLIFPEINFNNLAYESGLDKEITFAYRIEMAIHIELIKAGIVTDKNYSQFYE